MDIEKELKEIVKAKQGNKEFALFYSQEADDWEFLLGNESSCVMLGEVGGELETKGTTLPEVINKMKKELNLK